MLGARERTFTICGHHFALVCAGGLEPSTWYEYEVELDGERVWPEAGSEFPASAFKTYPKDKPLQIAVRLLPRLRAPHAALLAAQGRGSRAAGRSTRCTPSPMRMCGEPRERWPDALLMLGDQVYADEVSPATLSFIEARRDTSEPPGERVLDFEEYTQLYKESWSDPMMRWMSRRCPRR